MRRANELAGVVTGDRTASLCRQVVDAAGVIGVDLIGTRQLSSVLAG